MILLSGPLSGRTYHRSWIAELATRKELSLPPYVKAAALVVRGENEERVWEVAAQLSNKFMEGQYPAVEAGEPYPDVRAKLRDQYRYNIMLKSQQHVSLMDAVHDVLKGYRSKRHVIITLDVDP